MPLELWKAVVLLDPGACTELHPLTTQDVEVWPIEP